MSQQNAIALGSLPFNMKVKDYSLLKKEVDVLVKMALARWNTSLECCIPLIDEQHKAFFKALNTFVVKARAGHADTAILEELSFLENYIAYHCQAEEAFQQRSHYPNYRAHQASHNEIAYLIKSCSVDLKFNGISPASVDKFYAILVQSLQQHILVEDMAFCEYYKKYTQSPDYLEMHKH